MNEPLFEFVPPLQAERPYTVSEINEGISLLLESVNSLVWVEGEISNWHLSSNGHGYFRLKDPESQIPAVLWRTTFEKLKFVPEDGLSVFAIASIRVYRKGGYYQLDVHRMEPRGKGALFAAFEQLKSKLTREGLFDPAHKVPLPASIRRLGVVTSARGAAIHDIVRVAVSRAPQTDIVLVDVPVQGETAAPKIAEGLRALDASGAVDCIIVGRGGGSVEDLWPFNEEIVARAIYGCKTAVISAVGHEIDFTIADFVADLRAPTPSAAAEMALPDRAESRRFFDACAARFAGSIARFFAGAGRRFEACASDRTLKKPVRVFLEKEKNVDDLSEALRRRMGESIRTAAIHLSSATSRLHALSPLAVLARGYSVISTADGKTVRMGSELSPGQDISLRFHKGSAIATVDSVVP
jgi:exodeoxyribonuclease VII large subunit